MPSHEGHDHENTKAARAACRRGTTGTTLANRGTVGDKIAKKPAGKSKLAEKPSEILTQPHDFAPLESRPILCKHCGQTERGRLHDGVHGESRLHTMMEACKHPAADWVLRGATKKKTGSYYCKCGKYMGDEGPRDLSDLINGAIFGKRRR